MNGTIGVVDVRITLETHDGAIIYVACGGRIDFTHGPGTSPIYIGPTFERLATVGALVWCRRA